MRAERVREGYMFHFKPIQYTSGLASSKITVVFEYCGGAVKLNLKDEHL